MKYSELMQEVSEQVNLSGDINPGSIQDIIDEISESWGKDKTKPILLSIVSKGGDPTAASALKDILELKGIRIYTLAAGNCISTAALILQLGEKRLATKNSSIIIHEPMFNSLSGYLSELKEIFKATEKNFTDWVDFISNKIKIPEPELRTTLRLTRHFSSEEAKEANLIDDIVEP